MVMRVMDAGYSTELSRVVLDREAFRVLTRPVDVRVELYPISGLDLCDDRWLARMDALELAHVDLGVDAALIGLTEQVAAHVSDMSLEEISSEPRGPLLLLLRIAHDSLDLGSLLHGSRRLFWDYEEFCEAEAQMGR